MAKDNNCDGRVIVNMMKMERTFTDKAKFLDEMMVECAPKQKKMKGKKGKRNGMSGYNCYMRKCAKTKGKTFGGCLTDKGWNKLGNEQKNKYDNMAKEGCN